MATTPQTNTTLAAIADFLRARDDFVICGHVNPDGDCIGSQLALAAALRQIGKNVACVLVRDEPVDEQLLFLPGAASLVPAARYEGPCDTFVAVDVPKRDRLGDAAALLDRAQAGVTIDHHAQDPSMTELVYVDPDAAATTMLVWEVAERLGVDRSGDVALCCYAGLVTDTGRFQFQNTDAAAFAAGAQMVQAGADPALVSREVFQNRTTASLRLEARAIERLRLSPGGTFALSWVTCADFDELGAAYADAEDLVNVLRSIKGVRVACLLRERPDQVRGSLRAKDDIDVAAFARAFDGGGHRAAAGFTVHAALDDAIAQVWDLVVPALEGSARG